MCYKCGKDGHYQCKCPFKMEQHHVSSAKTTSRPKTAHILKSLAQNLPQNLSKKLYFYENFVLENILSLYNWLF